MKTYKEWKDAVIKVVKYLNSFDFHVEKPGSGNVGFYIKENKIGIVQPPVLQELSNYCDVFKIVKENEKIVKVYLNEELSTVDERSLALSKVLEEIRQKNIFHSLNGWRNETYPIYYRRTEPALFHIERTACPLFGFVQYGVHVNGYTYKNGEIMMWIGRRSKTKPTYPNMLDNMCAGGLASGLGVRECAIKECQEEGSVDDETLKNLKAVGSISYCLQDRRGILPEVQYLYDLEVSPDFVPKNADGEMENFNLYTMHEIQQLIIDGEFKPNCALVIIDFCIRHGLMTPEDDPIYTNIIQMMHITLLPPI